MSKGCCTDLSSVWKYKISPGQCVGGVFLSASQSVWKYLIHDCHDFPYFVIYFTKEQIILISLCFLLFSLDSVYCLHNHNLKACAMFSP